MDRAAIEQVVLAALRSRALENRGTLTPPQLPQIAQTIIDMLLQPQPDDAATVGQLVDRGLALSGVQAAGVALQKVLLLDNSAQESAQIAERLANVALAVHKAESAAIRREQELMRAAVVRALEEQRGEVERRQQEEQRLVALVQELSTPIIPVYDGILVVPLVGSIDTRRAMDITEQLLNAIVENQADVVLIDITGVVVIDTAVIQSLLQTTRAAQLLGTTAVMVGVSPEVAQTITQLGVSMQEIATLSNLQVGLEFALRRQGLAIQQATVRS